MLPHNPFEMQVTDAPVWPRRFKIAVIILLAVFAAVATIVGK